MFNITKMTKQLDNDAEALYRQEITLKTRLLFAGFFILPTMAMVTFAVVEQYDSVGVLGIVWFIVGLLWEYRHGKTKNILFCHKERDYIFIYPKSWLSKIKLDITQIIAIALINKIGQGTETHIYMKDGHFYNFSVPNECIKDFTDFIQKHLPENSFYGHFKTKFF